MKLARRIESVGASATIAITTRARQLRSEGVDVANFGAGEPDFDTPDFIKDAAKKALDAGDTKYVPQKAKALLAAIAEKLQRENGLTYAPEQIVMAFGGKHALAAVIDVLVDAGDKVLIPEPYWVSYPEMIRLAGGQPVFIPTGRKQNFKITPQQVLDYAKGAKCLILNSPSNPTGVTYTPQELAAIAQAVLKTDLIVLSDEIYEKLIYGATKFVSFAALDPALPARTITFNGLSKAFSMTGWRLGWLAAPKDVADAVRRLMDHQTTNPVSFAQAAALAAYTDPRSPASIEAMRVEFEKRGLHMARRLNAIKGISCVEPTGAFYCFPDVSAHYGRTLAGIKVTDSMSFSQAALEGAGAAVVPGGPFGDDACVRLSFAISLDEINRGLDRLEKLLA
ncbi:MAG: pyridoxal phosphate-dependent aminotransferase [Planctomycetaceae bacterium]|nr:pyridoxal phosphate-dependent aminotransferase [Planctomycetaceae bacterium]